MTDDKTLNFEELIRLACEKSIDAEIEEISLISGETAVSGKAEKRFFRRINYLMFKNSRIYRNLKKTVIICLAVLLITGAMVMTVEPVRVFFTWVYEKIFDGYSQVIIEPPKEEQAPLSTYERIVPQLREGWTIESLGNDVFEPYSITSPDGLKITYVQKLIDSDFLVDDAEEMYKEEIILDNGKTAYLYTLPNNFSTIAYAADGYIFKFSGRGIPRETIIELANSIKY